ncbi:MAG: DUF115 domain-containing protein [Verrucomicrobiota bacterium]|nr:DUF115 domain-containing protein [Verrucomicrobiota bacterium]
MLETYALLMERFPAIAFLLPHLQKREERKKEEIAIDPGTAQIIYFYGIGSLEAYFSLMDWLEKEATRQLIFVEDDPDEIVAFLHLPAAKKALQHPRIFVTGPDQVDAWINESPLARIATFALPSKEGDKYERWKEALLKKIFISYGVFAEFHQSHILFSQLLENLNHLPHSFHANALKGAFAGVPAMIAGAGPSLSSAIPLIQRAEKKALLIGGGSALPALTHWGIVPHFGLVCDPNEEELLRLKNVAAFEMPLLYTPRLFPAVFNTCSGPFGYLGLSGTCATPWQLCIEELLGLATPPVGEDLSEIVLSSTALSLAWAQFLGCNPIFLAGIDLAYRKDCRYAPGVATTHLPSAEILGDRKIVKNGVSTAVRWVSESLCFSRFAKDHPETLFFTLTQEGLGFSDIPHCPIEEAEEKYLTQEWPLKERVIQEILRHPMPAATERLLLDARKSWEKSLTRSLRLLEVLSGERGGIAPLAEEELENEPVFTFLRQEAGLWLDRQNGINEKERWAILLERARKHHRCLV